jgi:hypothetical protein
MWEGEGTRGRFENRESERGREIEREDYIN